MREIDDAGRAEDQHETERDERVTAPMPTPVNKSCRKKSMRRTGSRGVGAPSLRSFAGEGWGEGLPAGPRPRARTLIRRFDATLLTAKGSVRRLKPLFTQSVNSMCLSNTIVPFSLRTIL